jgi:hypothetical protein
MWRSYEIELMGSNPPIVRRVSVPEGCSFYDLHRIIQFSMGWMDTHYHVFISKSGALIGPYQLMEEEPDLIDETDVGLEDHLDEEFEYDYDFGDRWRVKVSPPADAKEELGISPVLLSFRNVSPTDDSGGLSGFYEKRRILTNKRSKEYKFIEQWMQSFPPRTEKYAAEQLRTYIPCGVRGDRPEVGPEVVTWILEAMSGPEASDLYIDVQRSIVVTTSDIPRGNGVLKKIAESSVKKQRSRYLPLEPSYEELNDICQRFRSLFGVRNFPKIDGPGSLFDVIDRFSNDSRELKLLFYSASAYAKEEMERAGAFIFYGYNDPWMNTELLFWGMHRSGVDSVEAAMRFAEEYNRKLDAKRGDGDSS